MRYQVSVGHNPPRVDDEICRVSRDGITVVACDFTRLAALSLQLGLNTRAEVEQEEREKCAEVIETIAQFRDSSGPTQ